GCGSPNACDCSGVRGASTAVPAVLGFAVPDDAVSLFVWASSAAAAAPFFTCVVCVVCCGASDGVTSGVLLSRPGVRENLRAKRKLPDSSPEWSHRERRGVPRGTRPFRLLRVPGL